MNAVLFLLVFADFLVVFESRISSSLAASFRLSENIDTIKALIALNFQDFKSLEIKLISLYRQKITLEAKSKPKDKWENIQRKIENNCSDRKCSS